jgi:hypothetical protein
MPNQITSVTGEFSALNPLKSKPLTFNPLKNNNDLGCTESESSKTPAQSARQAGILYASAKSEADYPHQELLNLVKKFRNDNSVIPGLSQEIARQEELIITCYPELKDKLIAEVSRISQEYGGNQHVIEAHKEYVLMNSVAAKLITVVRENISSDFKNSHKEGRVQGELSKRTSVQSSLNTGSHVQENGFKNEAVCAKQKDTSGEKRYLQSDSPYQTRSKFIKTTYPDQSLRNTVLQKEIEFFNSEEKFSELERYEQKLLNDNPELQTKMKSALAAAFKTYGGDFTAMSAERERVFQEFFANSVEAKKSDHTNSDGSQGEFWNFLDSFYRQDEDVSL